MKRKRNQLFVTALTAAMAVSLLSPAEPAAAAKKVKFCKNIVTYRRKKEDTKD